ncbi:MAG: ATP-binding protein, partial [Pseudomonadota bacterium]
AAVATFVTDARRLAGASPGAALARLRETEAIPILDRLSRMVMVLDTTSAQRMRWLEGLHLAALLAAITIIVANVLLVFRPGHRMVRSTISHLRDGTDSMERFTQAAAHDLKSPLRHVSGVLTVLEEDHGADLPGEARDLVEEARSSAERMQSLMVTLLAHARSGAAPLAMERLDLAELVADVEAELAEGLRETGGRVEIAAPLGYASGDRVLVRQLLANLIGNSVKYRAPDRAPVIRISVERFSDGLRLWVRDNGMGFDNAFAERIFEPFNRLHASNEVEGSGVGLATCRTICRRHGWRISAEGIPGEGAAFRIDLPV